jgi:hypothetical protein
MEGPTPPFLSSPWHVLQVLFLAIVTVAALLVLLGLTR